ncbi:MAG: LysM peptidoglycan-binding domain-containing protein [Cellvibrionales bacterium]|nr:LysM peptidoglycan-binding domain-containing protein [Cellvibrionales bacterium]
MPAPNLAQRHGHRGTAAIARGVRTYFAAHPPPGTAPAGSPRPTETFYTVVRGDTLSEIAERFNVPQTQLRTLNNLDSPLIKIGQRLRIPPNPKPP